MPPRRGGKGQKGTTKTSSPPPPADDETTSTEAATTVPPPAAMGSTTPLTQVVDDSAHREPSSPDPPAVPMNSIISPNTPDIDALPPAPRTTAMPTPATMLLGQSADDRGSGSDEGGARRPPSTIHEPSDRSLTDTPPHVTSSLADTPDAKVRAKQGVTTPLRPLLLTEEHEGYRAGGESISTTDATFGGVLKKVDDVLSTLFRSNLWIHARALFVAVSVAALVLLVRVFSYASQRWAPQASEKMLHAAEVGRNAAKAFSEKHQLQDRLENSMVGEIVKQAPMSLARSLPVPANRVAVEVVRLGGDFLAELRMTLHEADVRAAAAGHISHSHHQAHRK